MAVGKELDASIASKIRRKLLAQLHTHIVGASHHYQVGTGFVPNSEMWDTDLETCGVAAREIVECLTKEAADVQECISALVKNDEWVTSSISVAENVTLNCI